MLNLKLSLDPKNKLEMKALAAFASVLAVSGAEEVTEPTKVEEPVIEEQTEKPAPPKRKRKSKKQVEEVEAESTEAESAEAEEAESAEAESAEAEEAEEAETGTNTNTRKITIDDIRREVAKKKDVHLKVMKFELKTEYGAATVNELDEEHYYNFWAYVKGL